MKIVVCGFGRAGKECILQLLKEGHSVSSFLIFTHDDKFNVEFIQFLKDFKFVYYTKSINKGVPELTEFKGDVLLSVYYKFIIKEEVIELFNGKAMNCHPSLLPDYKGCLSSVWAILNGESETGISFHYIIKGVDEGNIILQKRVKILDEDTAFSLYHKLLSVFVHNFIDAFNLLVQGYAGIDQSTMKGQRRYYSRSLPLQGVLELESSSAVEVERFIKAMYYPPFAPAKFMMKGVAVDHSCLPPINSKYLKFMEV